MLQELSQSGLVGRSVLTREAKTHFWQEAYSLPITADALTEQMQERGGVFDWQARSRIINLQNQLNILQDQVETLRQENRELRDVILDIKPEAFKEEEVDVNINWSHVRAVVETAVSELNWNIEISIDTTENLIIVAIPEDQDDLIAETTFDFYSLIAGQLNTEVFKAINFFFVSDSD